MYERFTDRARKVMQLANQEAIRFNHEYIGTEHVLLGLILEGSGVAANVLKNMDINPAKLRLEIEKCVMPGPGHPPGFCGKLPQTPRTKKVVEYSIEEAHRLQHSYIGTEHLLLGLLREAEGVAAQVLMNCGVQLPDVQDEVLNLLGHPTEAEERKQTLIGKLLSKQERAELVIEEIEAAALTIEDPAEALRVIKALCKKHRGDDSFDSGVVKVPRL